MLQGLLRMTWMICRNELNNCFAIPLLMSCSWDGGIVEQRLSLWKLMENRQISPPVSKERSNTVRPKTLQRTERIQTYYRKSAIPGGCKKVATFRLQYEHDYKYEFSVLSTRFRFGGRKFSKCACSELKTRTRSRPRTPIWRSLVTQGEWNLAPLPWANTLNKVLFFRLSLPLLQP